MRRNYSDEDKASAYVALTVNDNNVTRAARDSGIPATTIRDWRKEWETEGVPNELLALTETVASDFVTAAERVRDLALEHLEQSIRTGDLKSEKLITVVGVLEDKIRLGKGLATSRSETVHKMPEPAELRDMLGSYVQEALEKTRQREDEIKLTEGVEIIPDGTSAPEDGG